MITQDPPDTPLKKSTRRSKAQRVRTQHFPGLPAFNAKAGNYSPLPWQYRTTLFAITPRAWMVFTYLLMRAGKESVVWVSDKEVAFALGVGYRKLGPYWKELSSLRMIEIREAAGERFIFLNDPAKFTDGVLANPDLTGEQRDAIRADLDLIGVGPSNTVETS